MGDDKLPLMDVNTEHPTVISTLQSWVKDYVKEYGIDGLRVDGELTLCDDSVSMGTS